ncbi:phage portal protein [Bdellovibrio bacteriovorus]|uniref:phage portal protein n=1 Tax=Bdellovibrio bacteriovorus TaxID=959 RepID=UPI0035A66681
MTSLLARTMDWLNTPVEIRGFDGAKKGRRLGYWNPSLKNPNRDIDADRDTLVARSRDQEQNDPFAKGAIDSIVSNVVGDGIIPTPYIFDETNDTPERYKNALARFDNLLEDWADKSACDFMNQTNLYGIQGVAMRTIALSGMVFAIRHWDPSARGIPLRIRLLEPDYLDQNKNTETKDTVIFKGIEISKRTWQVVAYWFYEEHPDGGLSGGSTNTKSVRIPAKDVLAPFMILRPGQLIGVPWMYSGLVRMHDFAKYEDAQLVKQQTSALTVTYITREKNDDLDEDEDEKYYETREPGGNIYLNAGETPHPANAPSVEGYSEFSQNALRGIARCFGITYEELTQDYSNVNFSSARMGWLSMNRNIKMWRSHMLMPMFLDKLGDWVIEAASVKMGDISYIRIQWTPPRREMIDPSKEISANSEALETLQTSLTEIYAESGRDFKKSMRVIQKEREMLKQLGIEMPARTTTNKFSQDKEDEEKDVRRK